MPPHKETGEDFCLRRKKIMSWIFVISVETECGGSGPMDGEIFVGGSSSGLCALTVEKKKCAKQLRFDFLQLEVKQAVQ